MSEVERHVWTTICVIVYLYLHHVFIEVTIFINMEIYVWSRQSLEEYNLQNGCGKKGFTRYTQYTLACPILAEN